MKGVELKLYCACVLSHTHALNNLHSGFALVGVAPPFIAIYSAAGRRSAMGERYLSYNYQHVCTHFYICPSSPSMSSAATLADEIKAANERFMARYGSGDMKSLSLLYTEDCKIMPTGSDVQEGRASTVPLFVTGL